MRPFLRIPTIYVLSINKKVSQFLSENYHFISREKSNQKEFVHVLEIESKAILEKVSKRSREGIETKYVVTWVKSNKCVICSVG